MKKALTLVIGCHRSGTSAVAGSLAAEGVQFGGNLIPPAFDNPKGFFESRRVVALHDRLLASVGASWDNPPQDELACSAGAVQEARLIVRDLPGSSCGIKDPRASLFVGLWVAACKAEDVRLSIVEVWREPADVAASLALRQGWDIEKARGLVGQYIDSISAAKREFEGEWSEVKFPDDLSGGSSEFFDPSLVHHGESCPRYSVIIPSCDDDKIIDCVLDVTAANPGLNADQIVVVSDGLTVRAHGLLDGVRWVEGKKPFVFAEAINAGVREAIPGSDIVILGDDVRFETTDGLDALASKSQGCALVVPEVIGVCGQPAQRKNGIGNTAPWLAFICAYIPRKAWNAVGPLDERFVGYGYDDVDWCRRAAGSNSGEFRIDHSVTVRHLDDSSFRTNPNCAALYAMNREKYDAKWTVRAVL